AVAVGVAWAGAERGALGAACHGADGNSLVPYFPKIAGLGNIYLLKQLSDNQSQEPKTDHAKQHETSRTISEMTGMLAGMSDQDLQDIAAHFASQPIQLSGAQELNVRTNAGIDVDALELGERVYRSGNLANGVPACTGCHAPDALGNPPAG